MGLMTKAEFDRLSEGDQWAIVVGFDVPLVETPPTELEQAIAERDAIIAIQNEKLVAANEAIQNATEAIGRCVERLSQ
jgi:hypothetical protein